MQPVKLDIPGKYWDSQVYQGRLYLFSQDGRILTYDWDALIDSLSDSKAQRLAIACAFRNSSYLYGSHWGLVFDDLQVKKLITSKFSRLAEKRIEISESKLRKFCLGEQENPFPTFPHADSVIYDRQLYVVGQRGVFAGSCNKKNKNPVSSRPTKHWDCPSSAASASYGTLAIATGPEGLWRMSLGGGLIGNDIYNEDLKTPSPLKLADRHCDDCEWMYHSIYGSSYVSGGFLASFIQESVEPAKTFYGESFDQKKWTYDGEIEDALIFKNMAHTQYSWGTRDKLYAGSNGFLSVARYAPWAKSDESSPIEEIGTHDFGATSDIVSGAVACFGTIVEYDDCLVVILSSGKPVTLKREPISWRVFPNSRNYQNHLHAIYDEHLTVFSFNHDYFVDQDKKIFGIRPMMPPGRRTSSRASF